MDQLLEVPDGRADLLDGGRLELIPGGGDYAAAIVRREADGSARWQALPPEGQGDAWVDVRVQDDTVLANSWSCWLVRLDVLTGAIIERRFTK